MNFEGLKRKEFMTASRKSLDYVPPRVDGRVNKVSPYPGFSERIIRILGTDSTAIGQVPSLTRFESPLILLFYDGIYPLLYTHHALYKLSF